jgi:hypothetical protein
MLRTIRRTLLNQQDVLWAWVGWLGSSHPIDICVSCQRCNVDTGLRDKILAFAPTTTHSVTRNFAINFVPNIIPFVSCSVCLCVRSRARCTCLESVNIDFVMAVRITNGNIQVSFIKCACRNILVWYRERLYLLLANEIVGYMGRSVELEVVRSLYKMLITYRNWWDISTKIVGF